MEYHVSWEICIEADSPEEAAQKAREFQGPDTSALVFSVTDDSGNSVTVDLLDTQPPAAHYTLEAGRTIVRDGVAIATVHGVTAGKGGPYAIGSPADLDRFAHAIVAALNTEGR